MGVVVTVCANRRIPGSARWVAALALAWLCAARSGFGAECIPEPPSASPVASLDPATNDVVVSWEPVPGQTSYDVFRRDVSRALYWESVATTSSTTVRDTRAATGTTWQYAVELLNNCGNEMQVPTANLYVPACTLPSLSAPTNLRVLPISPQPPIRLQIAWDPVPGARSYYVYRAASNVSQFVAPPAAAPVASLYRTASDITTTTTSVTLDDSVPTNFLWVVATATCGIANFERSLELPAVFSPPSEPLEIATRLAPPQNIVATDMGGYVHLTWDPVSGATHYDVGLGSGNAVFPALSKVAGTAADLTTPGGPPAPLNIYVRATYPSPSPGAIYTWKSAWSGPVTLTPAACGVIDTPSGIVATPNPDDPGLIDVSWGAVANALTYDVFVSESSTPGSTPAQVIPQTATSVTCILESASVQATLNVWVRANRGCSMSALAGPVAVAAPCGPVGVKNLRATQATIPGRITARWDPISAEGLSDTEYEVYGSDSPDALPGALLNKVSKPETTIPRTTGGPYYVSVKPVWSADRCLQGVMSTAVAGSPKCVGLPAPRIVSTSFNSTARRIAVEWTPAAPTSKYQIFLGPTGEFASATFVGNFTGSGYQGINASGNYYASVAMPDFNEDYWFFIVASVSCTPPGQGSVSAPALVQTYCPIPAQPQNLVATAREGGIRLSWDHAENAATYNVYRGASPDALSLLASTSAPSFYDSNLIVGTTYSYAVSANSPCAETAKSLVASATATKECPSLPAPIITHVLKGGDPTLIPWLSWEPVPGATEYEIYVSSMDFRAATTRNTTIYVGEAQGTGNSLFQQSLSPTAVGIIPVFVVARNECRRGPASASVHAWTQGVMHDYEVASAVGPFAMRASDGEYANHVRLTWTPALGATAYEVQRKRLAFPGIDETLARLDAAALGDNPEYFDTTAIPGTRYAYYVYGIANGFSSNRPQFTKASNTDEGFIFPACAVPPRVEGLAFTPNSSPAAPIQLHWTAAPGATSYDIARGDGVIATVAANTTSYEDAVSTEGVAFTYTVIARNACGASPASAPVRGYVGPCEPLLAPTGLRLQNVAPDGLRLSWREVTGATSYEVYRDGSGTPLALTTSTTYDDIVSSSPATRTYQVRARNSCAQPGAFSASIEGPSRRCTPAPQGLSATQDTNGKILVHFEPILVPSPGRALACGEPGIIYYFVRRGLSPDFSESSPRQYSSFTDFQDAAVAPGVSYYYWVAAEIECGCGVSDYVGPVEGKSLAALPTPSPTATPVFTITPSPSLTPSPSPSYTPWPSSTPTPSATPNNAVVGLISTLNAHGSDTPSPDRNGDRVVDIADLIDALLTAPKPAR